MAKERQVFRKKLGFSKFGLLKLDVKVEVDTVFVLMMVGVIIAGLLVWSQLHSPQVSSESLVGHATSPVADGGGGGGGGGYCTEQVPSQLTLSGSSGTYEVGAQIPVPSCQFSGASGSCTIRLQRPQGSVWGDLTSSTTPVACTSPGISNCGYATAVANTPVTFPYKCSAPGAQAVRCVIDEQNPVLVTSSIMITCVDTTVPNVSLDSASGSAGSLSAACSASDNHNLDRIELWGGLVGQSAALLSTKTAITTAVSSHAATVPLDAGTYAVYCKSVDDSGRTSQTASVQVAVPPSAPPVSIPTVAILSPSGDVSQATGILLSFTASDSPESCTYSVNGSSPTSIPGCANTTFSVSKTGWYTITVSATNAAGTGSAVSSFKVSTSMTVTSVWPPTGTVNYSDPMPFNFTVSASDPVDNCTLFMNTTIAVVPVKTVTGVLRGVVQAITQSILPNTRYYWKVSCAAPAGTTAMSTLRFFNTTNASYTSTITLPVEVKLNIPQANAEVNSGSVNFTFTANSSFNVIRNCSLLINGTVSQSITPLPTNSLSSVFAKTMNPGSYSWTVMCFDASNPAGFGVAESRFLYVVEEQVEQLVVPFGDSQPPIVLLTSPNSNTRDVDGEVRFGYNVSDSNPIDNCSLYVDNRAVATSDFVSAGLQQIFGPLRFSSGTYNWFVECFDNSSNRGVSLSRTIIVELPVDVHDVEEDPLDFSGSNVQDRSVKIWGGISAETITKMAVDTRGPIYQVTFETYQTESNSRLQVIDLKTRPTGVPGIDKPVYSYNELEPFNIGPLKQGVIYFRVPVKWLSENNLREQDVGLYRYVGDLWLELPTTYMEIEGSHALYLSDTPGFSYFLIGQKGATQTSVGASEIGNGGLFEAAIAEGTSGGAYVGPNEESPQGADDGSSRRLLVIIMSFLVAGMAVVLVFFWKREPPKQQGQAP